VSSKERLQAHIASKFLSRSQCI